MEGCNGVQLTRAGAPGRRGEVCQDRGRRHPHPQFLFFPVGNCHGTTMQLHVPYLDTAVHPSHFSFGTCRGTTLQLPVPFVDTASTRHNPAFLF